LFILFGTPLQVVKYRRHEKMCHEKLSGPRMSSDVEQGKKATTFA